MAESRRDSGYESAISLVFLQGLDVPENELANGIETLLRFFFGDLENGRFRKVNNIVCVSPVFKTSFHNRIGFFDQSSQRSLVMDNSGSMDSWGKLESAQNAGRAFVDLRQAGDMIGLARFWDTAATLYPLTLVAAAETQLEDVKIEIDAMSADGMTAIGPGLLEGKGQLEASGNPTHTWNIVLLGDGKENVPPCWEGVSLCALPKGKGPEFVSRFP